jgi:hypothetical protein
LDATDRSWQIGCTNFRWVTRHLCLSYSTMENSIMFERVPSFHKGVIIVGQTILMLQMILREDWFSGCLKVWQTPLYLC